MLAKNCTREDLEKALASVNARFENNITLKDIRPQGRALRFTLGVVSSKAPGARLGFPGRDGKQRRIASACWHVHGYFFDALPAQAVIVARGESIRPGDTWRDSNIGSNYRPFYFSKACECGKE